MLKFLLSAVTIFFILGISAAEPNHKILCTTFPLQLFTRNIMNGAKNQPELLLPANLGCPHDYVVTPQELKRASGDNVLLIANGLGLDNAICDALKKTNSKLEIFYAGGKGEAHNHNHDHGKCNGHHHDEGENPHVFASVSKVISLVENITGELCEHDEANAELYKKNAYEYIERLKKLAVTMKAESKDFTRKNVIAQHNIFEYFAEELGLKVVAVIQNEPGENPSASELIALTTLAKKESVALILTESQYPDNIARTLGRETSIPVVLLNPVANGPADAPPDYFEIKMRENIETLKKHLVK